MIRDSNKFDEVVRQDKIDQEFLFTNKKRRAIEKAKITIKTNEAKGAMGIVIISIKRFPFNQIFCN